MLEMISNHLCRNSVILYFIREFMSISISFLFIKYPNNYKSDFF